MTVARLSPCRISRASFDTDYFFAVPQEAEGSNLAPELFLERGQWHFVGFRGLVLGGGFNLFRIDAVDFAGGRHRLGQAPVGEQGAMPEERFEDQRERRGLGLLGDFGVVGSHN